MTITIPDLMKKKQRGEKITMLTAYDYPIGSVVDESGVDIVLVGDSLGMVVLGYETTAPVTMEEMLHHTKAVRRGVKRAILIGDMPLTSLSGSTAEAVRNAGRFMREAGCNGVKLEWKDGIIEITKAIVDAGIPVIGHVGLTPQTASIDGGMKVRGRDAESALRIVGQASALQAAGCFAMVLECVPDAVAQEISRILAIPTIGIGAGPHCDGQVLVTYDVIGLFERFKPKFAKRYATVAQTIREALTALRQDVVHGRFPGPEQTFTMPAEELQRFKQGLATKAQGTSKA